MSHRTLLIVFWALAIISVVAGFFPDQRFNIPIEYSTIFRIVIGAVAIGTGAACIYLYRD